MIPPMPAVFLPVWLGVGILLGWVGWRTQKEWWFGVAFSWFAVIGPLCWLAVGAVLS
jgi:hypothetical protein